MQLNQLGDFYPILCVIRASLVAHMVKNLPVMQETQVQSMGWEDPLKKGMATDSSIAAWRIPVDYATSTQSLGCKESDVTEQLTLLLHAILKKILDKSHLPARTLLIL